MPNAFRGPQDYLNAAKDTNASTSDLEMLAKSDFNFVKLAVIANPNVTADILDMCCPNELIVSSDRELALAIARSPKTPAKILNQLTAMAIKLKFKPPILDLALEICRHPHADHQSIKSIVTSENANSDFRNQLRRSCNRADIISLLDDIKQRNKICEAERVEMSEARTPIPKSNPNLDGSTPPIRQSELDARLIGSWTFTDSSSSSCGYSTMSRVSLSVHETFVFINDGRFFRCSEVFADHSSVASQMVWSHSDRGDRGRWSVRFGSLHLEWDDDYVSDARYYVVHGALELNWPNGPRHYVRN